ncbi:hypothetical protein IFM89_018832 [Coptis chinensis]|uniref:CRIB domain-containing protein n=1 Tax=Coptis chinensis TaxID=261450 RepID=A0A835GY86_9MAGN|nr:hypothetical protein IFM89_018832 [Coptis chinensis]
MIMDLGERREGRRKRSFTLESPILFGYRNIEVSLKGAVLSLGLQSLPTMATKIKGIYKGFKCISQIFVVKERELEIGYPTDVKHVAHIGWDGQSDNAPSWMKEFKTAPDFSTVSVSDKSASRNSNGVTAPSWSSRDFDQNSDIYKESPSPTERSKTSKKQKRKKIKSTTSSPKSASSRAYRALKSKPSFAKSVSQVETSTPSLNGIMP